MRLVVLYGPPGVGKLTVGNVLAALTGFKLFHNHLTVNLVTSVFPPMTDAWNRLAAQIRVDVFSEAAREHVDLILTRAPRAADQAEVDRIRAIIEPVRLAGGAVLFVQLTCDHEELIRRMQSESRQAMSKLTDPNVLVDQYDVTATLPFEPHLHIDTTRMLPGEVATLIARHFALPVIPSDEHTTTGLLDSSHNVERN